MNQSRLLGRTMEWSATLDPETEYKRPATLEEEKMFVIARRADEMAQLLTDPLLKKKKITTCFFCPHYFHHLLQCRAFTTSLFSNTRTRTEKWIKT